MSSVSIGLLGELSVRVEDRSVELAGEKQRLLLAALALRHDRVAGADELVTDLWGERVPPSARTTLRGHVRRLRTALGSSEGFEPVESARGGYRLVVGGGRVDLFEFRRHTFLAREMSDPHERRRGLQSALALFRGPPLSDLGTLPWITQLAQSIEEERLGVVEQHADLLIAAGRPGEATVALQESMRNHPFRESLWERLLRALHQDGRVAEALLRFTELRALLVDELGVEPSAPLQALHQQLLAATPAPAATDEPVRAGPRRGDAIVAGSTLFGRRSELESLDTMTEPGSRPSFVVVDGPVGVGKTTLVTHWAHRVRARFPGGVLAVDLQATRTGDPVSGHDALGTLLSAAQAPVPDGTAARTDEFARITAERQTLVLVDGAQNADQVRALAPSPGSVAVVTSRRQLRSLLVQEFAYRLTVPRLDIDDGVDLVRELGTRLFGAPPATAPTRELVELCGGLPLALRVAMEQMSRIPGLTPELLLDELRGPGSGLDLLDAGDEATSVPGRLEEALEPLAPAETRLIELLAADGVGEFGIARAGALLSAPGSQARVLLDRLVERNLVEQRSLTRYHLDPLMAAVVAQRCDCPAVTPAEAAT